MTTMINIFLIYQSEVTICSGNTWITRAKETQTFLSFGFTLLLYNLYYTDSTFVKKIKNGGLYLIILQLV